MANQHVEEPTEIKVSHRLFLRFCIARFKQILRSRYGRPVKISLLLTCCSICISGSQFIFFPSTYVHFWSALWFCASLFLLLRILRRIMILLFSRKRLEDEE